MKKIYIAMGLVMGMVMGLTSCENGSAYDESYSLTKKPEPTPEPTTPKDTTNWGTPMMKDLIAIGEAGATSHMWHGTQTFFRFNEVLAKNDTLVKTAEMPVSYELTPSEGFSMAKTEEKAYYTGQSVFSALSSNTSYGEWEKDAEGNMRRQVINTFSLPTSEFSKTLTLSHYEAYSTVNGRQHDFLHHIVSAQFVSLDSISGKEVEANDSIFNDVTYEIKAIAKFARSNDPRAYRNYVVTARHTVRKFLRLKEAEPTEPTTPTTATSDWQFVEANLVVNPNGAVQGSKGAFCVCVVAKNTKAQKWAIAVTKTWGKPNASDFNVYKFGFDKYPSNAKINSAIFYDGGWEPAHWLPDPIDPEKWWYEGFHNNLSVSMQEANIMGIRNFKGSHTAENTPKLNYSSSVEADGTLIVKDNYGTKVLWLK